MNKFKISLLCAFIMCTVFSFVSFSENCENISDKVLRFHIPANSNSYEDQKVKLKVKDELFEFVNLLIKDAESFEECKLIVSNNLTSISKKADSVLTELGAGYKASVSLNNEYFKTREYDDFTLPAGYYDSLCIKLGESKGENWWCAIYPSLCIKASEDKGELTDKEVYLVDNDEKFKLSFFIYECFLEFKKLFK